MTEPAHERELEQGLIDSLQQTLSEFGRGFSHAHAGRLPAIRPEAGPTRRGCDRGDRGQPAALPRCDSVRHCPCGGVARGKGWCYQPSSAYAVPLR
ncbi:hypothetical protein ACFV9C_42825 [Kribbella sp. NPDC059898]|uniref:hypothetical protein n=1 Tax=Kribbella sp. NPDC059898 TaxID=3346995 RepID=UPI00364A2E9D